MKIRLLVLLIVLGALLASCESALAVVTFNWTGNGGNSNWTNTANWSPSSGPAAYPGTNASDIVQIGIATYTGVNPNVDAALTFATLKLGVATAVTLTISNTLTITGTLTAGAGSTIKTSAVLTAGAMSIGGCTFTLGARVDVTGTGQALSFVSGTSVINNTAFFINVTNGDLVLKPTATVTIGAPLNIPNGALTLQGTSGPPVITSTLNLNAPASCASASVSSAIFNLNAPLRLPLTATGVLSATGAGSVFTSNSSGTISAYAMTINASSISFSAAVNIATTIVVTNLNANLTTYQGGTINAGSINLFKSAISLSAALHVTGQFIVNNTTAIITSYTGGSITAGSVDLKAGSFTLAAPLTVSGDFTVETGTGTLTTNASGNSIGTLTLVAPNSIINLNGTGSTIITGLTSMSSKSKIANGAGNSVIFNDVTMAAGVNNSATNRTTISNAGTATISGAAVMPDYTNINNSVSGTFTINNGALVTLSGANSFISNAGSFHAGTSGSACTINLNEVTSVTGNFGIANSATGSFYLGPASVIYPGTTLTSVSNASGGTFTLQSDQTGSAAMGPGIATSNSGTYNVERYIQGGAGYRGYRLLSSPVSIAATNGYSINYIKSTSVLTGTGGTGGGFDKAGNPTLYLYRQDKTPSNASFTSGNFRGIYEINTPGSYIIDNDGGPFTIPNGSGYLFFYRGDRNAPGQSVATETSPAYTSPTSATLTATGTLNSGNVVVKTWYSNSTDLRYVINGYTLVGNPYPSSIDWDTYNGYNGTNGISASNIFPSIYVFNANTKQYSTYLTSASPGLRFGTGGATNIIASGQGFFVSADPATSASVSSLTFTEAAKVASIQATGADLMMGLPQGRYDVRQLLRLKLTVDSMNFDDIAIAFSSNSSPKYNPWEDAKYLAGMSAPEGLASFSTDNEPVALSINFLPLPKKTQQIIRLKVDAVKSGRLTLQKTQLDSLPKIYELWLMDRYKKDSLDIRNNNSYVFDINKADTSSYGNNRFEIVVRQKPALGIHLLIFTATKATNGAQTAWKTENEEKYTNFTVERSADNGVTFDIMGGFVSNSQGVYSFTDKNPVNNAVNIYRLKIEDLNGTVTYSQTVALSYGNSAAATSKISVYPNPASGIINISIGKDTAVNTLSGIPGINSTSALKSHQSYAIKIVSASGDVVKTAMSSQSSWQDDVSTLLPGTYIVQVLDNTDKSVVGKATFVKL